MVGIIGQPGVGKSTLMKNLLHRNVTDERLYEADFIFCVKLRNFYDKIQINLLQFLMGNAAYDSLDWIKDSVIREEILKLFLKSESICILLDGFDEANISSPKEQSSINLDMLGQKSPEHFVLGLLSGKVLPKAKKLISSRPSQMLDLPDTYKPKFIVKISGFEPKDVEKICHNRCGDAYATQVFSHIESQPNLLSYCLIPINCVLTVHCIYCVLTAHFKEKMPEFLPKNITSVFVLTYSCFCKTNHNRKTGFNIKKHSHLKKIGKLAWNGIENQKLYFDENDLKDVGLTEKKISSFTVTLEQENQVSLLEMVESTTKKCIYFSHLLLQEFLAAVFCLHFMDSFKFKATFSYFNDLILTDNRLEVIIKFMFGLSNSETFQTLKEIYPKISQPTHRIKLLKNLALAILQNEPFSGNLSTIYVRVCCWAYEIQDSKFCKELSESFDTAEELRLDISDLLPCDILSLCHVIKTRKTHLSLFIFQLLELSSKKTLQFFCKEMESILYDLSKIKVITIT